MTPQEAAARLRLYASVEEDWLAREEATSIADLIEQQARQLEGAREALGPFVELLDPIPFGKPDDTEIASLSGQACEEICDAVLSLTIMDFRRAITVYMGRSTLKEISNG